MARYDYERLGAKSAAFLAAETSRTLTHSVAVLIFDAGPLANALGGVDFAAVRAAVESCLNQVPQYRRKLRRIPIENHPVWVDDREFNLEYHVRHTSLARPGAMDQLRTLCARIIAQRLDRSRPLWELWVAEGLEGGRFALILKTHHAMAEAPGGDLLEALLSPDAAARPEPASPFHPRPMPSAAELVRDEVIRQARLPRQALERARSFAGQSENLGRELLARIRAVARLLGYSVLQARETPLNGPTGPHRRFDHLVLPLADARRVSHVLGGTINDVVLATVAGAVAEYLRKHYTNPATLEFRVAVPVGQDDGQVGEWILELPIWEPDPARRLELIRERTEELNRHNPALGARTLYSMARWTSTQLLARGARALSARAPVNLSVTNVPGPQVPLYLQGARLVDCFGETPLREDGGLGVTVMSYDGKLCWGLNADYDRVPDLVDFTTLLKKSFLQLVRAAAHKGADLALVEAG